MRAFYLRLVFTTFIICGLAWASDGVSDTPATAPSTNNSIQKSTAEAPSITLGFQERIRNEDWNNALDLNSKADDERRQMRYRTRGWMKFVSAPLEFNVGIVDEITKKYALKKADAAADRFNNDEIVFESLNLKLKNLGISGLTITAGRQDIQRGEGFILMDGTSGDGSRTSYYNAVDITYERHKNTIEIIGIHDPRQDRFLGIVHDQHKYMNEWNEQAIGAYYTNRQRKDTDVDVYFFHKKEFNDYRKATNAQFQPDRHVETLGGRAVHRFP